MFSEWSYMTWLPSRAWEWLWLPEKSLVLWTQKGTLQTFMHLVAERLCYGLCRHYQLFLCTEQWQIEALMLISLIPFLFLEVPASGITKLNVTFLNCVCGVYNKKCCINLYSGCCGSPLGYLNLIVFPDTFIKVDELYCDRLLTFYSVVHGLFLCNCEGLEIKQHTFEIILV